MSPLVLEEKEERPDTEIMIDGKIVKPIISGLELTREEVVNGVKKVLKKNKNAAYIFHSKKLVPVWVSLGNSYSSRGQTVQVQIVKFKRWEE